MSKSPNKLIRFWQELKRRKVFSVVTTYAATAYIIIEVTNNIVSPLHLPAWIPTIVILLLITGLPIAIILSWIFDLTLQGLKKTESYEEYEKREVLTKPVKNKLRLSYVINAILLIAVIILVYPKVFKGDTLEKLRSSGERISVVVLPFQNLTIDTIWNVWQDGIQANLITYLSNNPEDLKVRQTESISSLLQSKGLTNYASLTPPIATMVSKKLEADVYVNGNISLSGPIVRLNAKLVDSKTEEIFKSFQVEGEKSRIFPLIDSLSKMVKDFLILSNLKRGQSRDLNQLFSTTSSVDAYRCFIYGNRAFSKSDWTTAVNWYLQAIKADSNYLAAAVWLSAAYLNLGLYNEGKKWCLNLYRKEEQLPIQQRIWANLVYAGYFQTEAEVIEWTKQLIEIDDQQPLQYYILGGNYTTLGKYEEAISALEKSLDIYRKWDVKPYWVYNYLGLGYAYHKIGKYNKEKRLYKKAQNDFPDNPDLIQMEANLYLTKGDTVVGNQYIEKYISKLKESSASEVAIEISLAQFYSDAGIFDKAEKYYRNALSLQPQNLYLKNILGYFLIDKERNVNEGLQLVNEALEVRPDDYSILESAGWGLYKQERFMEALDVLQKGWDLRRENALYSREAFLHLEAAKKAVAGMRSN